MLSLGFSSTTTWPDAKSFSEEAACARVAKLERINRQSATARAPVTVSSCPSVLVFTAYSYPQVASLVAPVLPYSLVLHSRVHPVRVNGYLSRLLTRLDLSTDQITSC